VVMNKTPTTKRHNKKGISLNESDQTHEHLAEKVLKDSDVKYKTLFENAQVGMYRSKLDGSALLAVNLKLCEIFGYTEQEMLDNPATIRWADPDARAIMVDKLRKNGLLHDYEMNILTKSGEIRTLSISVNLYPEQEYLEGSAIDITERKQTERALMASEKRFRIAAGSLTDVVYEWDLNDKVDWYGDIDGIMGYPVNGFPRTLAGWAEKLHPEDKERVVAEIEGHLKRSEPYITEYRVMNIEGEWQWWSARGTALRDEQNLPYRWIGSITDITELKRTEEELLESQEKYYYLYENAPVGMYHTKIDGSGIIEINNSACEMLGFKKEELIGQPSAIRWADPNRRNEILKIMGEYGVATNFDAEILKKDNTIISCLLSMKIFKEEGYIEGFIVDITERKRVVEALKISKEGLLFATEGANLGIWSWNIVTGELIWSDQCKILFGIPLSETMSYQRFSDALHPDDRERTDKAVKDAIDNHRDYDIEYRSIWPDESIHWLAAKGRGYYDNTGKPLRLEGIVLDITGNKKTEEEIRKLNNELENRVVLRTAQLEASNKELEAFSYSVSHDLRAPLRHVSGYVELLNTRFYSDLPEKGRHYLNSIADSVRIMGVLIDDLLQFSKTGRMEIHQSDVAMNEIVREVKESLCKVNPDREIEWVSKKLPNVIGDEAMLKVVWTNLLSNAIKFTRTRVKARIEIGVLKESKELVFFVRDNGVGFDMKYAEKLFGVFQRLHPTEEFEGTGIGLANVQRIVLRSGGRTWAEAIPDKGAVFYFSVPKK
jgi:PAS domain S-box-containing protein